MATPTMRDLKAIMLNEIQNNPVTINDVKMAEKIHGPDISVLKGKTTRSKPARVTTDLVEIPRLFVDRNRRVNLCVDVVWICGLAFLSSISKHIMYRTCQYIPNLKGTTYQDHLDKVIRLYNRAGFKIRRILCDNAFKPIMEGLEDDMNCQMNFISKDEHVPEAERNN